MASAPVPGPFVVAVSENDMQFVNRRGRQNHDVAFALENLPKIVEEVFVCGEIKDDVSVEGEMLLLRRHRSSSLPH